VPAPPFLKIININRFNLRIPDFKLRVRWLKPLFLFLFFGFITLSFFAAFRLVKTPRHFENSLVAQIEEHLGANLSFEKEDIVFSPFPALRIKQPRLESVTEGFPSLKAEEARFSFQFFPLLWGQAKISGFQIRKGEGIFGGIPLRNLDFKVKGLHAGEMASFQVKVSDPTGKEIIRGKGKLNFPDSGENLWDRLGLTGDFTIKGLSLEKNFSSLNLGGELAGKIHLEKKNGKNVIAAETHFSSKNFRYGSSLPFSLTSEIKLVWDKAAHSVEISEISAQAPFGEVGGRGMMNSETGEMGEVRLTAHRVISEELVRHFPGLQSALPTAVGFSGPSELDISLLGTWDYLTFHLNGNLTPVVLTYGKIFSKPKDFPMSLTSDLLLKKGSVLSGDFSLRTGQTTIKGAFVNLDLKSGVGEITLITNKFDLIGWETLLIPFAHYEISGAAKILFHAKGDLTHLDKTDRTLNLTLEHTTLLSPDGRGIRQASGLLDLSSLSLRVKDTSFELGNSPIRVEMEIFNWGTNPQGIAKITSPHLDPFAVLENLKMLAPFVVSAGKRGMFNQLEEGAYQFFPKSFVLEKLEIGLKAQSGKIAIEHMDFEALDGNFHLRGETEWPAEKPNFSFETELEHVHLAKYFEQMGQSEKILDGNLFFKGKFQGQGIKSEEISNRLSGEGTLSITNGDWRSVDLMKAVSSLESFGSLQTYATGSTLFHDLKAGWKFSKSKFETDDLLLISDHLWVEGKGNLSLEGQLNSRFEIYFSEPLTAKILDSWNASERASGKQLGPFPFLLIGHLQKTEMKPDEKSMGSFLEAVRNRRFRRILHAPFRV